MTNTIPNVPRDFKKRPVIIQAIKWTGDNLFDVIKFMSGAPSIGTCIGAAKWKEYCDLVQDSGLIIKTLEGQHIATVGDMIIRGVKGEFYPCKPDIFDMTYELSAQSPADHVEDVRAMVADPSPAGVDGLEVVAWADSGGALYTAKLLEIMAVDSVGCEPLCRLSDAQAIIDGLRGELKQSDRARMNQFETIGKLQDELDQQAQRTGELEAALEFACKALAQVTSSDGSGHADIAVSVLRMAGTKDADALHVVEAYKAGAKWRINAALSAGKEGE